MTKSFEHFELFTKVRSKKIKQHFLKESEIEKIKKKVCSDYGLFLQEHGIAGYDKGFLWSVNPYEYTEMLADWNVDPKTNHIIARTAFGDLFIWTGKQVMMFQVNYNKLSEFGSDIPFLYDFLLSRDSYLRSALYRDIFDKALKKLGPPDHDECYGFFPALPLGGKEDVKNLQKVKLIPYLDIVVQAQN